MKNLLFFAMALIMVCGCTVRTPAPTPIPSDTPPPKPTATPTPIPTAGLGSSWTRPADGMRMVYVPAGEFSMGSVTGTIPSSDDTDEYPLHKVFLYAYWFDKTDVTNAMYAICVQAGGCTPPGSNASETRPDYYINQQYSNFPILNISWKQASKYCQWAGASLPSEAQWEKAARGTDGRVYPWGNELPTCTLANYGGRTGGCVGDTTDVDSHPSGASPYGALDMAGNLWQWVADWYDRYYYASSPANNPTGPENPVDFDPPSHVLRGGSWLANPEWIRSANRVDDGEGNWDNLRTFRCAMPAP
jgi:eukaryotic-like serine/threonine-protein kinase